MSAPVVRSPSERDLRDDGIGVRGVSVDDLQVVGLEDEQLVGEPAVRVVDVVVQVGHLDQGAAAIVVSNHGARQLDTVAPTIRVLPEVVQAVKGQTEILLDCGIRRGSDVVKALCLGASAVLIGRSYAYGLGAGGQAGVARAIDILKTDVIRTMKLLGCSAIKDLDGSYVDVPSEWTARLPR